MSGRRWRSGEIRVDGNTLYPGAKVEWLEEDLGTGAEVEKVANGGYTFALDPREGPWVRMDLASHVRLPCGTSDEEIKRAQDRAGGLAREGWLRDVEEIHEMVGLALDRLRKNHNR